MSVWILLVKGEEGDRGWYDAPLHVRWSVSLVSLPCLPIYLSIPFILVYIYCWYLHLYSRYTSSVLTSLLLVSDQVMVKHPSIYLWVYPSIHLYSIEPTSSLASSIYIIVLTITYILQYSCCSNSYSSSSTLLSLGLFASIMSISVYIYISLYFATISLFSFLIHVPFFSISIIINIIFIHLSIYPFIYCRESAPRPSRSPLASSSRSTTLAWPSTSTPTRESLRRSLWSPLREWETESLASSPIWWRESRRDPSVASPSSSRRRRESADLISSPSALLWTVTSSRLMLILRLCWTPLSSVILPACRSPSKLVYCARSFIYFDRWI